VGGEDQRSVDTGVSIEAEEPGEARAQLAEVIVERDDVDVGPAEDLARRDVDRWLGAAVEVLAVGTSTEPAFESSVNVSLSLGSATSTSWPTTRNEVMSPGGSRRGRCSCGTGSVTGVGLAGAFTARIGGFFFGIVCTNLRGPAANLPWIRGRPRISERVPDRRQAADRPFVDWARR